MTEKRRIGKEIQPLGEVDQMLEGILSNEPDHMLYGYTFDREIQKIVNAKDNSYCVAVFGGTPFNGISSDGNPFVLSEEEQNLQEESLKALHAWLDDSDVEQAEILFPVDREDTWRLIAVTDHAGNSKVHTHSFYEERIFCIAKNVRYERVNAWGNYVVHLDFIQNPDGQWINRHLQTSLVSDLKFEDDKLTISTRNSVYVLRKEAIQEQEYQDAAELIELWLDDSYEHFCKGIYYNQKKEPKGLIGHMHTGMFTDTYLVGIRDEYGFGSYVCRYYLGNERIEFYDTLYNQQDYSTRMLIHNTGTEPLQVAFEGYHATWTIQPGKSKSIMPFREDGADKE